MGDMQFSSLMAWHQDWREKVEEQKRRGLNEFNLLTIVLEPTDEVRLHSRFLREMLDPSGSHGQGSLFLELFLEKVGLSGFVDLSRDVSVRAEYSQIDLYIESMTGKVIVENKIHAADQERQIQRYVDYVLEREGAAQDEVAVLYLTPDGRNPSDGALGSYIIDHDNECIRDGEKQVGFKAISYRDEICSWVLACKDQVCNLSNLSQAFEQYFDVVMRITGRRSNRFMNLVDFYLKQDESVKTTVARQWLELYREFPQFRRSLIKEKVLVQLQEYLSDFLKKHEGWVLEMDVESLAKKHTPLLVCPEGTGVCLALEFDGNDYHLPYYGIKRRSEEIYLKKLYAHAEHAEKFAPVAKLFSWPGDWWAGWRWYKNKKDLIEVAVELGGEECLAKNLFGELCNAFELTHEYILWANTVLYKEKN